jgi:hypothetical protein
VSGKNPYRLDLPGHLAKNTSGGFFRVNLAGVGIGSVVRKVAIKRSDLNQRTRPGMNSRCSA